TISGSVQGHRLTAAAVTATMVIVQQTSVSNEKIGLFKRTTYVYLFTALSPLSAIVPPLCARWRRAALSYLGASVLSVLGNSPVYIELGRLDPPPATAATTATNNAVTRSDVRACVIDSPMFVLRLETRCIGRACSRLRMRCHHAVQVTRRRGAWLSLPGQVSRALALPVPPLLPAPAWSLFCASNRQSVHKARAGGVGETPLFISNYGSAKRAVGKASPESESRETERVQARAHMHICLALPHHRHSCRAPAESICHS
ncbi:hypothetical protein J6590_032800, partial [Homalodisca vitripennis]